MPGNGRKVSLYFSERGSTVTAVSKSALICKDLTKSLYNCYYGNMRASVAQLVELLICNQWVGGSSPFAGFTQ